MKKFIRRIVLAMLLGVVLYGAFVAYTGYRDIQASLSSFRWSAFALALILASGNYGLRFLKWSVTMLACTCALMRRRARATGGGTCTHDGGGLHYRNA